MVQYGNRSFRNSPSFVRLLNAVGISPSIELAYSKHSLSWSSLPSSDGNIPVNEFWNSHKVFKLTNCPSSVGKGPLRHLEGQLPSGSADESVLAMRRSVRATKLPISVGRVPVNKFADRSKRVKVGGSWPICD